jgi:hypothetical protein
MSQYVRLGTQCESQTIPALTSNAKYILPQNNVYYKRWTPMMYYPGMEQMQWKDATKLFGKGREPKHIKAYESNNSIPRTCHQSQALPVQPIVKGCHRCKTWN